MRPTSTRRPTLPALVIILVASSVTFTGCLFPPIDADQIRDEGDDDDPLPTTTPTAPPTPPPPGTARERTERFQDAGRLDASATIGETTTSTERHTVDLPAYLLRLTLHFEWDADAGQDLDLALRIESDGETIWTHTADGGRTGEPDTPVERDFDLSRVAYLDHETLLIIDVRAEATHETLYEFSGTYTYQPSDAP